MPRKIHFATVLVAELKKSRKPMIKLMFRASPLCLLFLLRFGVKKAIFLRCKLFEKVGLMFSHTREQGREL